MFLIFKFKFHRNEYSTLAIWIYIRVSFTVNSSTKSLSPVILCDGGCNLELMGHPKGSAIATWKPWKVVPLFDEVEWASLPRYLPDSPCSTSGGVAAKDDRGNPEDDKIWCFIRTLLRSVESWDLTVASIVVALRVLIDEGQVVDTMVISFSDNDDAENAAKDDDCAFSPLLLQQSWELVRGKISYNCWNRMVRLVCRSIYIVGQEHPLATYAVHQVPHLSVAELGSLINVLRLATNSQSPLAVQKLLRDLPLQFFAVIPTSILRSSTIRAVDPTNIEYLHSCLPTAQLELLPDRTVAVTALYQIEDSDTVTLCYVRDGTFEQRDAALQKRLGCSCTCLRCRYELSSDGVATIPRNLTRTDATRLGHYYIAQNNPVRAKRLYQHALQRSTEIGESEIVADICHALGAIELSGGNFLAAQRIWKQAADDYPDGCQNHTGISLQLRKIKSYEYLDARPPQDSDEPLRIPSAAFSLVAGAYITHVLDNATCNKVICWAETLGSWTQQRHYEVPTFDVPIHTVPPLLDWFQHEFMTPVMQRLLARQFNKKEHHFYVHDAFCVRYEAGAAMNHLPVHTDEASHSLVVSLNDGFEGGGTYFFDADVTCTPAVGSVLSFRGDQTPHGGAAVTRGIRYILAVFLYYDEGLEDDRPAVKPKRPASERSQLLRESKLQKAEFSFSFALNE